MGKFRMLSCEVHTVLSVSSSVDIALILAIIRNHNETTFSNDSCAARLCRMLDFISSSYNCYRHDIYNAIILYRTEIMKFYFGKCL